MVDGLKQKINQEPKQKPKPKYYRGNHPDRNDKERAKTMRAKMKKRDTSIVKKRLEGKSARQIAEEMTQEGRKITPNWVYSILKKEEVKEMLEREYCKLASVVPKVTENIIEAAAAFAPGTDENNKISWEANKLIAQAHGLVPTSQQSIVHQTYINTQVNNVVPDVIRQLAAKHFAGMVNFSSMSSTQIDNNVVNNVVIDMEENCGKEG